MSAVSPLLIVCHHLIRGLENLGLARIKFALDASDDPVVDSQQHGRLAAELTRAVPARRGRGEAGAFGVGELPGARGVNRERSDDLALVIEVEEDCDVVGVVRPGLDLRHVRPVRGDLVTESPRAKSEAAC